MSILNYTAKYILFFLIGVVILGFLSSCGIWDPADARKIPANVDERVKKNLEEGKGFRLFGDDDEKGGNFDFASSNPLWRASLETIDFLPLMSANYSGGIIISDWYSGNSNNESIKITIRFLSNEIRVDALEIKIFSKKCGIQSNCTITENDGQIVKDLKKKILKEAAIYEKELTKKNKKKYLGKIR